MADPIGTIFTAPGCTKCTALKKQLDATGHTYTEQTVDDDIRERLLSMGMRSLPVFRVEYKGGFRVLATPTAEDIQQAYKQLQEA